MKDHLLSWLGLTDQQSLLVGIILDLQSNNKSTAPINIEKEYIKHTNNFIQKSNLFTQLKILQEKKIIRKGEQSKYYLDIDGIKEAISIKKQELTKRLDEITHLESETDLLLEKIGTTKKPSTIYLNEQELYKRIISALQNAENLYLGCDFPHYSYPLPLCTSSYQMLYIETLNEKLNNKDFKLFCLC